MPLERKHVALSRRAALTGALAGTLGFPAIIRAAAGAELKPVKLTISWVPEGTFAYVFIAKSGGFWAKQGLDVSVSRGFGALATAQVIAQGQFPFGTLPVPAVMLLASKGVELTSLAMLDYDVTMGIATLEETPIRTPKDFIGKKVGQTLNSADAAFFAPFLTMNGVDPKQVNIVSLDPRIRDKALLSGQVDAVTGNATNLISSITAAGKRVRFLSYSDFGISLYGNICLVTSPKIAAEQPELCQQVTDGLLNGLKYSMLKPDDSETMFLKTVPELGMTAEGREFTHLGMGFQRFSVMAVPDAKIHGLGWSDAAKLAQSAEIVIRYQGAPGAATPDTGKIFGNRFAGRVTFTDAEWDAAKRSTEAVGKLLDG